jgi:hypothetical protein
MFTLKFFSGPTFARNGDVHPPIPTYRAMAVLSYEISPPIGPTSDYNQYASVVMHLLDGSTTDWPLRGNEYLIVENANGKTIDKIRNPAGSVPETPSTASIYYPPPGESPQRYDSRHET